MKIVAIGGGNNSDIGKDGTPRIYEHENIDKEIIKLSGKKRPNVLFISHATSPLYEMGAFNKVCSTYGKMYNCPVKLFSMNMLNDIDNFKLVDWADVIYVGGGDTKQMLDLWVKSGLDQKLIEASKTDKVLCGTSAGGGCWFKYICSDYLQMETGNPGAPYMAVKGLGLVDMIFNPHADDHGRMRSIKNIIEEYHMKGLSLTDNMAIEIIDDEYKLISGKSSKRFSTVGMISYWKNNDYIIEPLEEKGLISELVNNKEKTYLKKK